MWWGVTDPKFTTDILDTNLPKVGKSGTPLRSIWGFISAAKESSDGANVVDGELRMTGSETQMKEADDRMTRSVGEIKYF